MMFDDFLFLCGACIVFGLCLVFGGALGFCLWYWLADVFNAGKKNVKL